LEEKKDEELKGNVVKIIRSATVGAIIIDF
jgi:DNA-directed RNA polymerase subunit H (RpoH/RPB5)